MKRFFLLLSFLCFTFLLGAQVDAKVTDWQSDSNAVFYSSYVVSVPSAPKYSGESKDNYTYVYICNSENAYAYHKDYNCWGLQRCKHEIIRISLKEAKAKGFRPCKICYKHKASVYKLTY